MIRCIGRLYLVDICIANFFIINGVLIPPSFNSLVAVAPPSRSPISTQANFIRPKITSVTQSFLRYWMLHVFLEESVTGFFTGRGVDGDGGFGRGSLFPTISLPNINSIVYVTSANVTLFFGYILINILPLCFKFGMCSYHLHRPHESIPFHAVLFISDSS